MPPNPPVKQKQYPKGKPLGIPIWGWAAALVIGVIVGYMVLKKSGSAASTSDQSSGLNPSPLGDSSGGGGGIIVPPPQTSTNAEAPSTSNTVASTPANNSPSPDAFVSPANTPADNGVNVVTEQQAPSGAILNAVVSSGLFSPAPSPTNTVLSGGMLGTVVGGGYGSGITARGGTEYQPPSGISGSILESNIPAASPGLILNAIGGSTAPKLPAPSPVDIGNIQTHGRTP